MFQKDFQKYCANCFIWMLPLLFPSSQSPIIRQLPDNPKLSLQADCRLSSIEKFLYFLLLKTAYNFRSQRNFCDYFILINSNTSTVTIFSDFHRHTAYRREVTCGSRINADPSQRGLTELLKNLQSYWRETLDHSPQHRLSVSASQKL